MRRLFIAQSHPLQKSLPASSRETGDSNGFIQCSTEKESPHERAAEPPSH
jgi:hypothetical protein